MASSSMCGPSNPLQSLKNHAASDRSLQQDRFRSASPASSQFRQQSHLNPHQQHHDEFEQFLSSSPAGPSQTALRTRPSLQNFSIAPPSPAALHQPAWAADFQRLQLSTPPPSLQIHNKPAVTGWGAEFLSQLSIPPAQQSIPQQNAPVASSGFMPMNGINASYLPMATSSYEPLQSNHVDTKTSYTDAEFDQMFEEAATLHSDIVDFPQREAPNPLLLQNTNPILQSDDVKEDVKEEQDQSLADADELARTAGQLVDTLSQDTSRKFQESQFVALMRKLRDKTVKVEDGKMVEV
ncbi:hypothetical protein TWF225_003364 [Orbilia oligospora]|uniref:Peroxin 20 n=1 Tax=Orbilia oligospora TaxID=2813651 RepID=A0A8H2HSB5_ORBOL|nr:hypothetical protein TWF225_003364 [Orbilia oligospora]KAF3240266.1 hypothetical protein TWF217_000854 [Orbilia oligospora]KAF3258533.1 hypothetical protein TWF128_004760 [Orbilia oligospora]KAF3281319.1 hypothetical protein TWF132_011317 [Orbilia oligospora]TGJ69423.1 hypothetical protein EYR41_005469 [Orbilia oligospora]